MKPRVLDLWLDLWPVALCRSRVLSRGRVDGQERPRRFGLVDASTRRARLPLRWSTVLVLYALLMQDI